MRAESNRYLVNLEHLETSFSGSLEILQVLILDVRFPEQFRLPQFVKHEFGRVLGVMVQVVLKPRPVSGLDNVPNAEHDRGMNTWIHPASFKVIGTSFWSCSMLYVSIGGGKVSEREGSTSPLQRSTLSAFA